MKKLFLVFLAATSISLSVNAQACQKASTGAACCAKKSAAAAATTDATSTAAVTADANTAEVSEAEMAASTDVSIQKRVSPETGDVSFYQKSVCEVSHKVSWDEVKYDGSTKKFTKVASASMEKDPQTGEVKKTEACSKVGGSAACCSKDKAKTCCAKKGTK